jgi:hypothetical protein
VHGDDAPSCAHRGGDQPATGRKARRLDSAPSNEDAVSASLSRGARRDPIAPPLWPLACCAIWHPSAPLHLVEIGVVWSRSPRPSFPGAPTISYHDGPARLDGLACSAPTPARPRRPRLTIPARTGPTQIGYCNR